MDQIFNIIDIRRHQKTFERLSNSGFHSSDLTKIALHHPLVEKEKQNPTDTKETRIPKL